MSKFGLTSTDLETIIACIRQFPEIEEALIFGSRAMGNFKKGSDIDLCIKGSTVFLGTGTQLHMCLEETPLPYFFDVVVYHAIDNPDLKDHIDRVGQTLYKATPQSNPGNGGMDAVKP